MEIYALYQELLRKYGKLGWWPVFENGGFVYKPRNCEMPNKQQQFIIALSAILTQNTAWKNVENVVKNLHHLKLLDKEKLKKIPVEELAKAIKSSGYCNQKARKIKEYIAFLDSGKEITRENLLSVWGIGKETADSILLYAYHQPYFVIDAYTKRVFAARGLCSKDVGYDELQSFIVKNIPKDIIVYKEFHALLVEEGKLCLDKFLWEHQFRQGR